MQLTELNAISPIDGRYRSKTISLSPYFSEEALIKYRVLVEVEYFIALREADVPQLAKIDKSIYDLPNELKVLPLTAVEGMKIVKEELLNLK